MAEKLSARINSGLETVRQWESDKELFKLIRNEIIPFHLLCPQQYHHLAEDKSAIKESPYVKPDDQKYQGDDLLLKRLTLWFQKDVMTWVNNPSCDLCGSTETKCRNVRGPISPEERIGRANRVEVYYCKNCNAETTLFPRYNSPRKLLETKRGRCGEYANLFGVVCRAAGFETRYILDFTDHVWTEVYSHRLGRWLMCDSCEGQIDASSMYEKGWGKELNCILGFTTESVVDVTRRYTRKFKSQEFQNRRRKICPGGEFQAEMIIAQFNANIRSANRMSAKKIEELNKRMQIEKSFLQTAENRISWDDAESYNEGRRSGSIAWKIGRGEAGSAMEIDDSAGGTTEHNSISVVDLSVDDLADITKLSLRCEDDAVPSKVLMRLPDAIMPLATQQIASIDAKKEAFVSFVNQVGDSSNTSESSLVVGFCTKPGLPIYLISNEGYPFEKISGSKSNEMNIWKTFHFVPKSLVGEEQDESKSLGFNIPVDEEYFTNLLGDNLLKNEEGQMVHIPTISTLRNSRLVALYFSAHFCPPCRQFTPMLCEFYLHLKSVFPDQGLELIFVSSDRDSSSFDNYFRIMPWTAIPYASESVRRIIGQRFGLLGIPALVVLDTISGNIVASTEESRPEVGRACQMGNDGIESLFSRWIDQIPEDSKAMMETLKLSCVEDESDKDVERDERVEDRPIIKEVANKPMTNDEFASRFKGIFRRLVDGGSSPNEAAAQALLQVNAESIKRQDDPQTNEKKEARAADEFKPELVDQNIASLIIRYISKVEEEPSVPKFRLIRFCNKVFDQVMVSTHSLKFLEYLGFHTFHTDFDFVASIPLSTDISLMKQNALNFASEQQ